MGRLRQTASCGTARGVEGRRTILAKGRGGPAEKTHGRSGWRDPGDGKAAREPAGEPGHRPQRPGGADWDPASRGARAIACRGHQRIRRDRSGHGKDGWSALGGPDLTLPSRGEARGLCDQGRPASEEGAPDGDRKAEAADDPERTEDGQHELHARKKQRVDGESGTNRTRKRRRHRSDGRETPGPRGQ